MRVARGHTASKWQSQALSPGLCVSKALPLSVRLQLKFVLHRLGFKIACLDEQGVVLYSRFPLGEHMVVDRCLLWYFNYIWCSPCLLKILEELQSVHQSKHRGHLGSLRGSAFKCQNVFHTGKYHLV